MQTFLFVLGPFLLQAGAGLGFLALGIGAARALVKRAKATASLKEAEEHKTVELLGWARDCGVFLSQLLVNAPPNALDDTQEAKLVELVTTGVSQKTIDYIDAKQSLRTSLPRRKGRKELA